MKKSRTMSVNQRATDAPKRTHAPQGRGSWRPTVPDFSTTTDLRHEREARLRGVPYVPERPVVSIPLLVIGGGLAVTAAAILRKTKF